MRKPSTGDATRWLKVRRGDILGRFERFSKAYWTATRKPLLVAVLLSSFVLVADLLGKGRSRAAYGVPIVVVIGLYVAFALLVGLVVAIGGSWASTRWRGAVLGFCAAALAALAFQLLVAWPILRDPLSPLQLVLYMAFMGIVLGLPLGAMHWSKRDS